MTLRSELHTHTSTRRVIYVTQYINDIFSYTDFDTLTHAVHALGLVASSHIFSVRSCLYEHSALAFSDAVIHSRTILILFGRQSYISHKFHAHMVGISFPAAGLYAALYLFIARSAIYCHVMAHH